MSEKTNYEKLAAIDVSAHVEKKANLTYLSWAWAVDQLLRADSAATWLYNAPVSFPDGTMMVNCTVTAFGKPMTMQLPVMDYRNKAISNPDAFAVNTAMMRCLVKAIALHGLGLYIYAGEDLPLDDEQKPKPAQSVPKDHWDSLTEPDKRRLQGVADTVRASLDAGDMETVMIALSEVTEVEEKTALWSRLDSKERAAIKKYQQTKEGKINV